MNKQKQRKLRDKQLVTKFDDTRLKIKLPLQRIKACHGGAAVGVSLLPEQTEKIELFRLVAEALVFETASVDLLEDKDVKFLLIAEGESIRFQREGVCSWSKLLCQLPGKNIFLFAYKTDGSCRSSEYEVFLSQRLRRYVLKRKK